MHIVTCAGVSSLTRLIVPSLCALTLSFSACSEELTYEEGEPSEESSDDKGTLAEQIASIAFVNYAAEGEGGYEIEIESITGGIDGNLLAPEYYFEVELEAQHKSRTQEASSDSRQIPVFYSEFLFESPAFSIDFGETKSGSELGEPDEVVMQLPASLIADAIMTIVRDEQSKPEDLLLQLHVNVREAALLKDPLVGGRAFGSYSGNNAALKTETVEFSNNLSQFTLALRPL